MSGPSKKAMQAAPPLKKGDASSATLQKRRCRQRHPSKKVMQATPPSHGPSKKAMQAAPSFKKGAASSATLQKKGDASNATLAY